MSGILDGKVAIVTGAGQPRPARSLHRGWVWTASVLAAQLPGAFGPSLTPLERSADVFSWDSI